MKYFSQLAEIYNPGLLTTVARLPAVYLTLEGRQVSERVPKIIVFSYY